MKIKEGVDDDVPYAEEIPCIKSIIYKNGAGNNCLT